VDDHSRPVNHVLNTIDELVEEGKDVLSQAELSQLQGDGRRLRERYGRLAWYSLRSKQPFIYFF
jgi:hypothetical protein